MISVAGKTLFAERLRQIRTQNGLSQEAFALKLGISRSAYQYYERGEREAPMYVCAALADSFDIDPMWLMFEDGERRVLDLEAMHAKRYCKIFEYIDQKLLELNRYMSAENKEAVAIHLGSEDLTGDIDVSKYSEKRAIILENLIANLSMPPEDD